MKVRKIGKRWKPRTWYASVYFKKPGDKEWTLMHSRVSTMDVPKQVLIRPDGSAPPLWDYFLHGMMTEQPIKEGTYSAEL